MPIVIAAFCDAEWDKHPHSLRCPPHESRFAEPADSAAIQPCRRKLLAKGAEGEVSWQRKLRNAAHIPDAHAIRRTAVSIAAMPAADPSKPARRTAAGADTPVARRRPT
jgi:hypothetical protein